MTESEKDARIAELEQTLRDLCGATADAFLGTDPADKRTAALRKVYAEARRLGVHP